jgi:hypothetical protein
MSVKSNTTKQPITITDEHILSFYQENPNINIVQINHVFIDILKKLSTNLTETLSNSINSKILTTLTEITGNIHTIKQDVSKLSTDILSNMTIKLHELKKEYIDSMTLVLVNNTLSNYEKIGSIIEKQNDALIAKTTSLLTELVPKTNEAFFYKVENGISLLTKDLTESTKTLINQISQNTTEQAIKDCLKNVELQMDKSLFNVQQPIFAFIQSSEQRTSNNLQLITDKLSSQTTGQETLSSEIREFLNKYKYNSSMKGSVSETELFFLLQQIFPTDEVIDCRGETATCDYKVNRRNKTKPTILFENKDYSRSANTEEVNKFCRDVLAQKQHGVFLSQNSNITYKNDFQIDIVDGLIHVYICNVKYNREKIQIAVDIIDNLSQKMSNVSQNSGDVSGFHINKDDIDSLLSEYISFNAQKTQIVETVRTSTKLLVDKIDELQLFAIKRILAKNGTHHPDDEHNCRYCNSFSGKNKASLAAHLRNCKSNPSKQ